MKNKKIFKPHRNLRTSIRPDKSGGVNFPKTLFGFYWRFGFIPLWKILSFWCLLFIFFDIGHSSWWPQSQKMIIALFESPTASVEFLPVALQTIILVIGLFIVFDLIDIVQNLLSARWRPKVQEKMGEVLNEYIHSQSMKFFTGRIPGKMNSQISYIYGGFGLFYEMTSIVSTLGVILVNMGLEMQINSLVALVLLGAFLFRLLYSISMVKIVNSASKKASEASSTLAGHIVDSLSGFSIVKLFAGAGREKRHLRPLRDENIKRRMHSSFVQRFMWGVPMFLWDILFGVVLLLMVKLYMNGQMKVSEVVFTLAVYQVVMGNIGRIARSIPNIMDVIGSAQQSYKELVKPIEITDVENAPDLKVSRGEIRIDNVLFEYKNDVDKKSDDADSKKTKRVKKRKVLDDFSLTIRPGEKIGLVGSSGAGKTTLVNLLMRFYDPGRGAIYIDGQNIAKVTQDSLRESIAFIPQEPAMFNRTLRENIGYGKPDATDKEIKAAAKSASADEFIMETIKKYDSMVGDRGIKLSGGQRQRIAIARAFLKDAPILILDEATSALDSETEATIQKSFEELSRGRTTIAIAHRLSTLRNMDRIVVMDKGKIVESGTHTQLLRKNGGIYAKLWKMQSGGFLKG